MSFSTYFNEHIQLKSAVLLTLFSGRELFDGTHPGKILATLPDEYVNHLNQDITSAVRISQLLSKSLRSREEGKYWASTDSIQMLYQNDKELIAAQFYLGLIYEKSSTITLGGTLLTSYLKSVAASIPNIEAYISFIKKTGQEFSKVEAAIKQVQGSNAEAATAEKYVQISVSFADAIDQTLKVLDLPLIKDDKNVTAEIRKSIKQYLSYFREANNLGLNIARKKYGAAVVNTYSFYLMATGKKDLSSSEKFTENPKLKVSNTTETEVDNIKEESNTVAQNSAEFIKKYGNFMANMVDAKSSKEVADAIEAIALPVGSASIKRHSNWNVSLNAFVGPYIGSEKISGIDVKAKTNAYGLTAPIGIALSKGFYWRHNAGVSLSVFGSIIDLGAPVAFRFKDDKTEEIPSIKLKDIISPGIFFSVGLPYAPISLTTGWQRGPVLRKIDPSVATFAGSTYTRFSVSLAVDIPILNLYSLRKGSK